jgi:hypothetical protein
MAPKNELAEQVETFQNSLLAHATGGSFDNVEYQRMRTALMIALGDKLPKFVRVNRDTSQLWAYFKKTSPTYQGRREYIWAEFEPLLAELEGRHRAPADGDVTDALSVLSSDSVRLAWDRALERRVKEPDAAITSARTLLETVCKHVLDDLEVTYTDDADLPKLYRLTAEALTMAPSQQTEPILRQVLGGCTAVVEGIGAMRNKLSDAHGKGRATSPVQPRHASLAVNVAGAAAMFIVESWEART